MSSVNCSSSSSSSLSKSRCHMRFDMSLTALIADASAAKRECPTRRSRFKVNGCNLQPKIAVSAAKLECPTLNPPRCHEFSAFACSSRLRSPRHT
jgi:hypothetical protein